MPFLNIYLFCKRIPFLKGKIQSMEIYEGLLYPGDGLLARKKAMQKFYVWVGACLSIFAIQVISGNLKGIFLGMALVLTWMSGGQLLVRQREKEEMQLLRQFAQFMEEVRHHFYQHQIIDLAVDEATWQSRGSMYLHGCEMCRVLTAFRPEEEIEQYENTVENRFLRTFLSVSLLAQQYGDRMIQGSSLYLRNIFFLKQELHQELLQMEKNNFLFSGLAFVALFPLFALAWIRRWAVMNMPDLEIFYRGRMGEGVEIILFFLGIGAFGLVNSMKTYEREGRGHWEFLEKAANWKPLSSLLSLLTTRFYGKTWKLGERLKKSGMGMSPEIFYTWKLLLIMGNGMVWSYILRGDPALCVGMIVLGGGLISLFPNLYLAFKERVLRFTLEEEVFSFQAIALMLMHMPHATVQDVLLWMERFSRAFQESIRQCIDEGERGEEQALIRLQEQEKFPPFVRFIEHLIASDSIGLEKAFSELEGEREYHREKRKFDFERILQRKSMLGKGIAFFPLYAALAGYLILPFVYYGLLSLQSMMNW